MNDLVEDLDEFLRYAAGGEERNLPKAQNCDTAAGLYAVAYAICRLALVLDKKLD